MEGIALCVLLLFKSCFALICKIQKLQNLQNFKFLALTYFLFSKKIKRLLQNKFGVEKTRLFYSAHMTHTLKNIDLVSQSFERYKTLSSFQ